jgi:hypothetical protein
MTQDRKLTPLDVKSAEGTKDAKAPMKNIVAKDVMKSNAHYLLGFKRSRKQAKTPMSEFTLFDIDGLQVTSFFVEHDKNKSYPIGSCDAIKVKKGFNGDDKTPAFALKVYPARICKDKKEVDKTELQQKKDRRAAMRAAYCYRLLGRTGLSFQNNNKQYLLSDWLPGTPLATKDTKEIAAIPIDKRIYLALTLINEIAILHNNVHSAC